MKKNIDLASFALIKTVYIINGVSFVSGVWFWYKYYFDNAGKGFDDFLYIFSIYSLNSFFAAKALSNRLSNEQKSKNWIFLGLFFITASTLYVSVCLFDGKILIPIALNVLSFLLFIICLGSFKNIKTFDVSMYGVFLSSLIMSALPILAFILVVFGKVWLLFYDG